MLVLLSWRSFWVQNTSTTTAGLIVGHSRRSKRYSWSVPYPETPAATILWLEMRGLSNSVKRSSASASSPQTNESPRNTMVGRPTGSELEVAQTKAFVLHREGACVGDDRA